MSDELPDLTQMLDPFDDWLIQSYEGVGVNVDNLPYTDHFEQLFAKVCEFKPLPDDNESRHFVLMRLLNLRKRAALPRLPFRRVAS